MLLTMNLRKRVLVGCSAVLLSLSLAGAAPRGTIIPIDPHQRLCSGLSYGNRLCQGRQADHPYLQTGVQVLNRLNASL